MLRVISRQSLSNTMRSAVLLLGFLLACADAFLTPAHTRGAISANGNKPSFLGQSVARTSPVARATLVASLEDIESKLMEAEKAKIAIIRGTKAALPNPPAVPKPAEVAKAAKAEVAKAAKVVAPSPAPKGGKAGELFVAFVMSTT